jgi:hypothetical protein
LNLADADLLLDAWAKSQVLCGVIDPKLPEAFFPKGRLHTIEHLVKDIHQSLSILKERIQK